MKKHELLKHAYDNYPKGIEFQQQDSGLVNIASGNYNINNVTVYDVDLDVALYVYTDKQAKWAEIVKPKIAVKVENEKEFNALMKYYDSLGYVWNRGDKASSKKELPEYPNVVRFENEFQHSLSKRTIEYDGYTLIPFKQFAKEHDIKLPLFKTHDGVYIYDGDNFCIVEDLRLSEWVINPFNTKNTDKQIFTAANGFSDLLGKPFSTKQSALQWIEAQKTKDIIISADSGYPIIVYAKPFLGNEYIHLDMSKRGDYNGANLCFTIKELREAVTAYESLHDVG